MMYTRPSSLQGERHVLLDEEDGHALPVEDADDVADLRDHAGHQPLGGFVEENDLGLQHHGPRDGQHLLLAAGEGPARLIAALAQAREALEDTLEQRALSARSVTPLRSSPTRRFSCTVSSRKMRRSSGTQAMPWRARWWGATPAMGRSSKVMCPRRAAPAR